jgi:hypothetical protein
VLVSDEIFQRFKQSLLRCRHSNQVLARNHVAAVCCVYTLILHCLLFILLNAICSLHQEENCQPIMTPLAATPTTTATIAAAATGADTTPVKRASSGDAISAVQKPTKLQPFKLRRLDLNGALGASKLKLHSEVAVVQDGVCSKWAVVQMLPETNQCLLMVSSTT